MESIKDQAMKVGDLVEDVQKVVADNVKTAKKKLGKLTEDIKDGAKNQAKLVVDIAEDVQKTMIDNLKTSKEKLEELTEDIIVLEPKLRRETFENSSRMGQAKERRFLLVVILITQVTLPLLLSDPYLLQTMAILLMLGLQMFLSGPAPASTPPKALISVDYLR